MNSSWDISHVMQLKETNISETITVSCHQGSDMTRGSKYPIHHTPQTLVLTSAHGWVVANGE
jgi:hypothetical protein